MCVCVWLHVMWYHPDVREGPGNIRRHQECETHKATDVVLLLSLTLMNVWYLFYFFASFIFLFIAKVNFCVISLLDDRLDICISLTLNSVCRSSTRERPKLLNAAHIITFFVNKTDRSFSQRDLTVIEARQVTCREVLSHVEAVFTT